MWDWIAKAHELQQSRTPFALVTVVAAKGSTPREPGAKLLVLPDGAFHGTVGGGQLERLVLEDARQALGQALAGTHRYPLCFRTGQCCGGSVEVFIELVGLGPELYLFGAGHVGRSLCQTLEGTPFRVHLIDARPEWLLSPEIPQSVVRHGEPWEELLERAALDRERSYAVVMTHDHQLDLEIVAKLVSRPARFIGLIGSETKWERFRQRLTALGADDEQIGRVQCPVGLGDFGKAPREVAISIAGQLLRMHHGT